ncbi:FecR family protein [Pedobacter foliorum]|uniref:FecR family protein n=1 Tax=Pedobacter foliorum TaxID=2739058 RepID=UPI0015636C53|nr:FecR family protein [Pedobacter foliorum]NRF40162.1 FecR family protein [Pedobacter foliorum]
MMNELRLTYLYRQYISNRSSAEELQELEALLKNLANEDAISGLLDTTWDDLDTLNAKDISQEQADLIYNSIIKSKPQQKRTYKLWAIRIAASILLCMSIGLIIYRSYTPQSQQKTVINTTKPKVQDFLPGKNKAVLTLSNGNEVILDDTQSGRIANQGGVVISKLNDGQIAYSSAHSGQKSTSSADQLNTLTIPKGGQYQLTLPDGTLVYLNSASSLTYPTKFAGTDRKVTLSGEAYFEVAKNPKMPFIINVNNKQEIQVLGTHFNVEAYTDERVINTTLLEGSVKILYKNKQAILKPGQVAINSMGTDLDIKPADIDEAMAWKNGLFIFNNENITTVMKKISRWYDVEVVFKGNMENVNFLGNYSRTKSLASLLKNIELMENVNISIEGRRITVTRL